MGTSYILQFATAPSEWSSEFVIAICFSVFLVLAIGRLLIENRSLRLELVNVASRIKESQIEMQNSITNLVAHTKAELKDHHTRILRVENVHQRWGEGHLIDNSIAQLRERTEEQESELKSVQRGLQEVKTSVQVMGVQLQKDLSELKQLIGSLSRQVDILDKKSTSREEHHV